MKESHIINMLERVPFASLSEGELREIRLHATDCDGCARAYKLAMISAELLAERVSAVIDPSPFFHTRVLAAMREQQNEAPAFARLWRAAGALVSSMAAAVALFAVLGVLAPASQTESSALSAYSAEEVILNQTDLSTEQLSNAQVLSVLYDADEAGK